MLGCRELWGDVPTGEQRSWLDVSSQEQPHRFSSLLQLLRARWSGKLREDEQRVGKKGLVSRKRKI